MNWKKKKVLVVGTGKSGIAATEALNEVQAEVILQEGNETVSIEQVSKKLPQNCCCKVVIGTLSKEIMEQLDLVVLSPGVPTDLEYIEELRKMEIPIWGEVELAYAFSKGKIIGITGTNGKTTTTALVGEIIKTYYSSVFVVGNIGTPYCSIIKDLTSDSITVAELSSFQLETIWDYKPDVSAILNITPDHLDRHHTMEQYIRAKVNITKNQGKEEYCILNYEDEVLRKAAQKISAKVYYFSSKRKLDTGIYLENENIIYREGENEQLVCSVSELHLLGEHNYENVMAAVLIALKMNVPMPDIQKAITSFTGVEHRIEFVAQKNGVNYYNDSKGTNPDAAIKAIQAMKTKTVLIGGGYDKNSEYDAWIEAFKEKTTCLVLLGQTKEKIAKAAKTHGFSHIIMADSLKEAVDICAKEAKPGESVLLSPACASWGMFQNYEERGRLFKEYVNQL